MRVGQNREGPPLKVHKNKELAPPLSSHRLLALLESPPRPFRNAAIKSCTLIGSPAARWEVDEGAG